MTSKQENTEKLITLVRDQPTLNKTIIPDFKSHHNCEIKVANFSKLFPFISWTQLRFFLLFCIDMI